MRPYIKQEINPSLLIKQEIVDSPNHGFSAEGQIALGVNHNTPNESKIKLEKNEEAIQNSFDIAGVNISLFAP